jgi:hypothetical protein
MEKSKNNKNPMNKTKKCFSKCRKVPKDECTKQQQCIYINGQKYKYCRLSHKYYLDDACNAQLKTKTLKRKRNNNIISTEELAGIKIKQFIMTKKRQYKEKQRIKAQLNITKTLKKGHIESKNLQTLCSDSSICIAFGKNADKISQFFNNFKKFDYVKLPIRRIGVPSVNGFIHEIEYSRFNYNAYSILKSSASVTADNLFYEYKVGQYINTVNKILPSFVETYGLFQYKNNIIYDHFKKKKVFTKNVLTDAFSLQTPTIKDACEKSNFMCILVQHIKNAETLKSFMNNRDFINSDLMNVLFQVYASLSRLSGSYTHYDLHTSNVLLYKPVDKKYIIYHYHFASGLNGKSNIFSFKCQYIAKIIDYGRSHYNENASNNSRKLHEEICKIKECEPKCGEYVGFTSLQDEVKPPAFSYIESTNVNESHDLRLLSDLRNEWGLETINPTINGIFKKIVYGRGLTKKDKPYGTREEKKSGLPKKINNVTDAYLSILNYLQLPNIQTLNNNLYSSAYGYTKLGDLHIYIDGSENNMHYEEG